MQIQHTKKSIANRVECCQIERLHIQCTHQLIVCQIQKLHFIKSKASPFAMEFSQIQIKISLQSWERKKKLIKIDLCCFRPMVINFSSSHSECFSCSMWCSVINDRREVLEYETRFRPNWYLIMAATMGTLICLGAFT